MSDLTALTATQLVAGYAAGDFSPVEAARAVLERAEEIQPRVNAFVRLNAQEALEQARASEERWRRGAPQGLLDGVPVTIKDMLLQRGAPTLKGSWSVPDDDGPYEEDAPSVARMREHGAVFVGKTTTPEF
ncbi:MAG TPA: amidase family protein, partial [Streptomyces sp.]|nr:amidase family protein [Streptomyces sp.]